MGTRRRSRSTFSPRSRYTLQELERKPELVDRYVTLKIRQGYAPKTVTNHLL